METSSIRIRGGKTLGRSLMGLGCAPLGIVNSGPGEGPRDQVVLYYFNTSFLLLLPHRRI